MDGWIGGWIDGLMGGERGSWRFVGLRWFCVFAFVRNERMKE